MDQFSNTPVMPSDEPAGLAGWFKVWIKAITQPNEQSYVEITTSPNATQKTAFIWVFIAGTVAGLIQAVVQTISLAMGVGSQLSSIPGLEQYMPSGGGSADPSTLAISLITGICGAPLGGLLAMLFFAIGVAIVQWVAKLFGGTGSFEKLAYGFSAISLPITLFTNVFSLVALIPYVGLCGSILSFGLGIYSIYLQVVATKAVNQFGWGQAAGSVLIPVFVLFTFCCCVFFAFAAATGAAFSQFAP